MSNVIAYYADRYGVEAPPFALYIGADVEAVRSVFAELGGHAPETITRGGKAQKIGFTTHAIFIQGDFVNKNHTDFSRVLAHEYFHVLQHELSNYYTKGTPDWLHEGTATYEGMTYSEEYESKYRNRAIIRGANYDGELRDLATEGKWERTFGYPLGALATEFLIERAGASSHVEYWRLLTLSATWQDAFVSAFQMTVDEFYEAFDEYLGRLFSESPAGWMEGTILGPAGEPLQGLGVLANGRFGTYGGWLTETQPDGMFGLYAFDGPNRVRIYVREDDIWRQVGWYGEGGFATDRSQATVIEVGATDVTGIEIRLPANPTDLPEVRIPRVRGTVLGADGTPLKDFGVWVWGGSADESKIGRTSVHGTFDIAHQNGTFVLRIYRWKDKAWHLLGYYSESGFTLDEAEAASIEVDGADVSGIEIKLPWGIRGAVLGPDRQPAGTIGLWLWDTSTDGNKFVGAFSDGTFDVFYGDGTFTLQIYAWDGGGWRHVGWYGGATGFTTDSAQATVIEVDGADVTGIEIHLPADPADLPTIE